MRCYSPQASGSSSRSWVRSARPSRTKRHRCSCIHKEYAGQGVQAGGQPLSTTTQGRQQLLSVPEDVVLECLTVLRRGELSGLQPYLPADGLAAPGAPVMLAGVPVHEQGPLARCAPFMDTAARRVLPGHLLRRARVLSSVKVGGSCILRVAVTACTGEETVLVWRLALANLPGLQHDQQQQQQQELQQQPQQQRQQQLQQQLQQQHEAAAAVPDDSSAAGGIKTYWRVMSVQQEGFTELQQQQGADAELPVSPHPRYSPELVVLSQLTALRQQQLLRAAGFNLMGRHVSSSGWEAHFSAFRQLLQQEHYSLLSQHQAAALGSSALPSQRQFLQEVLLVAAEGGSSGGRDGGSGAGRDGVGGGGGGNQGAAAVGQQQRHGRFLWRLGMQADGCWMVRSIEVL